MTKIGIQETFHLGDGASTTLETGKLAKQADGSVVVTHGNTMLLATIVSRKEINPEVNFLPLTVDYKEKYAAAGRFPGGFFKREARPSEHEILISRLIDRALRPMFPGDYRAETQLLVSLISADRDISPDAYACLAASAALQVSDIPVESPVSEVRVAQIDGKFVINPLRSEIENATLELIVAGSMENVNMVEGEMEEASEETMMEAIKAAHAAIKVQCQAQIELRKKVESEKGPIEIREYEEEVNDEELKKDLHEAAYQKAYDIAREGIADKKLRAEKFDAIIDAYIESMTEEEQEEKAGLAKRYYHDIQKEAIRNMVLDTGIRLDGRKLDEIRPIWSEIDYLPAAHGSAVFTRGETQSLTTVTLGSKLDEQVIDGAIIEEKQDFILHYNFPPFSTGEAKRVFSTSRREHGHGNLALRALKPMIPGGEENPYTIRVVSDILESNGSSSMATVCAGTLALMDAGVKIRKPVSGIAMGLIADENADRYAVLSDILGDEDHLGDMDFKVTGTRDGITACQMDIKVAGLSYKVMGEALAQAKKGRMHILDKMAETIEEPREDYKDFVPRIESLIVAKEFIGAIIGPGGKVIQEIQSDTNTTITIEEVGEFGHVDIMSPDKESITAAKERIQLLTTVPEVGEVYKGKVKNIVAFGAFVEILPGKEGLLHISELEWRRVNNVEDVLKTGQEVEVKLIDIDKKSGKLKLSRKALLPKPEGQKNR
ncbi:MAG: polyribonucleotide nucleotidyltransferase [Bacteroidota bacterium]